MNDTALRDLLEQARSRRATLTEQLRAEGTDSYRLFHGGAEGLPGLTIDRYGELTLAQTFREPLSPNQLSMMLERYGEFFVYNHRGSREEMFARHQPSPQALDPVIASELGLRYWIWARHKGIDPHLFLDLRMGRRWIREWAKGKTVLNLFAYSCGLGQVAAASGAIEVWNVDFSASALEVGKKNLDLNQLSHHAVRFIQEDYFPVIWQLANMGVKGKRARRPFLKIAPKQFDLVLLDPPGRAKGPFHSVDLVHDYQSLFKPAWLVTAPGGVLMATNNVGSVNQDDFEETLARCAKKCGKPIASFERLTPDSDFPSHDDRPALKVVLCRE